MTEDQISARKRVIRRSCHSNETSNPISSSTANQLSRSQQQQQRVVYIRKKPEGLMCSICEGPAHGYNFNAITCESCKAFFRRNALKSQGKLKCRLENGRCVINMATRKRCKACRLMKCFEKGMRADWILTDEERINKRQKIEENRRLRQILYPDLVDNEEMELIEIKDELIDRSDENNQTGDDEEENDTDRKLIAPLLKFPLKFSPNGRLSSQEILKIQQIRQAYVDSVRLISLPPDVPSFPHTARINATIDMVNLPANIQATRLITFFKLLPEFSSLNEHDKLLLIKYNTFPLTFIRAALNYNPLTDTYHEPDTEDCVFEGRDLIPCFGLHHYERSTRCVRNLLNTSLGDRILLQMLLLVILYSKGSSICMFSDEAEPVAENISTIFRIQNYFIDLLWKYCDEKFGTRRTREIFLRFTLSSMDAHREAFSIRHNCVKVNPVAEQLAPLMKSVMLIA